MTDIILATEFQYHVMLYLLKPILVSHKTMKLLTQILIQSLVRNLGKL